MTTAVQDLMSSPPVTCPADTTLSEATSLMDRRQIGSVVVTDRAAVIGILTERDLMRAAAAEIDPHGEPVRRWMTADPDVLGVDDEVDAAWSGLTHHHYRHLPVVDHGDLVGVVSMPRPVDRGPDPPGRRGRSRRAPRASRVWWWPRPRSAMCVVTRASTTTGSTRLWIWPPPGLSRTCGCCSSTGPFPTGGVRRPSPVRWPSSGACPRRWPDCCRRWPPPALRWTPCAPQSPSSVPSRDGPPGSTSTPSSDGPRPSDCALSFPPSSPPSTA